MRDRLLPRCWSPLEIGGLTELNGHDITTRASDQSAVVRFGLALAFANQKMTHNVVGLAIAPKTRWVVSYEKLRYTLFAWKNAAIPLHIFAESIPAGGDGHLRHARR